MNRIFFSNAEAAIIKMIQEKATAQQWLSMLKNNGGLKSEEDKWMGLSEWLESNPKRPINKDEILRFIRLNQIQIEEVLLGNRESPEWRRIASVNSDYYQTTVNKNRFFIHPQNEQFIVFDEKGQGLSVENSLKEAQKYVDDYVTAAVQVRNLTYTTPGTNNHKTLILSVPTVGGWNEEDFSHYGDIADGKAIAWIRFSETIDNNGGKVLVLDEIQSKRHQEGRKYGYKTPENEEDFVKYQKAYRGKAERLARKYGTTIEKLDNNRLTESESQELNKLLQVAASVIDRVPEAPFEKKWHELAMKRMIRYAAENHYDVIAWTTGSQQIERYNLNQAVNASGMRGFYDKILVDFGNKYCKRWGVRVGDINLPVGDNPPIRMHSIAITDQMRQSTMQGQLLFKEINGRIVHPVESEKTKIADLLSDMGAKLGQPIVVVEDQKELPIDIQKNIPSKQERDIRYPAVYDPCGRRVYFVLSDINNASEAATLFLHEVVAHKGIEGLLGPQKARVFYNNVFDGLDKSTQAMLIRKYKNRYRAGAEYVATVAEENADPSLLAVIINLFKEMLCSVGINVSIARDDIRVMLARSRSRMAQDRSESKTLKSQRESKTQQNPTRRRNNSYTISRCLTHNKQRSI